MDTEVLSQVFWDNDLEPFMVLDPELDELGEEEDEWEWEWVVEGKETGDREGGEVLA